MRLFKEKEEEVFCRISQVLYFLHDGERSGTYSRSESRKCGGRRVCDEFPEPRASAVTQDWPPLPLPVFRRHRSWFDTER